MKKILLVLMFVSAAASIILPQNVELGFEVPVQLKSKETGLGNGVNFSAEYIFGGTISLKTTFGGISDKTAGQKLVPGTYSMFWAEESAEIRSTRGILEPYCGIGVGYYKTDINLANSLPDKIYHNTVSDKIKYSFGYNLRGGADISLSKYFRLNTEFKYIIFNPSMTVTDSQHNPPSVKSEDINLNAFIVQAGVEVKI